MFFFLSLDLDAWINEPIYDTDSDSEPEMMENLFVKSEKTKTIYYHEPTEEDIKKVLFFNKYPTTKDFIFFLFLYTLMFVKCLL